MAQSTRRKIAVLGAGAMGTAVAVHLAKNGHRVWLWDYNPGTIHLIKTRRENPFLPGVALPKNIFPKESMQEAVETAEIIVIASSSPYTRNTARHLSHCLENDSAKIIAHVSKGLEEKTMLTMHGVIQSELAPKLARRVVTISGPSIAKEIASGIPTAVVAASESKIAREIVHATFESPVFKVAVSRDILGVGLCGTLKNVYAIALGICDGMKLSMNGKAFMLTAATKEMEKIVRGFGGKKETVYGLAGLGDLIVTGLGDGRNRALGEKICIEGNSRFAFEKRGETYEGVEATKNVIKLIREHKIKSPLARAVYDILYRHKPPEKTIRQFFARAKFL